MSDVGQLYNSYDWAQSFDKLKRALTSILVICFLGNILLVANGFIFFENYSSLFDKLLRALVEIAIRGNMIISRVADAPWTSSTSSK